MKVKLYIDNKITVTENVFSEVHKFTFISSPNVSDTFSFKIYPNWPSTTTTNKYEITFSGFPIPSPYSNATMAKNVAAYFSTMGGIQVGYTNGNTFFTVKPINGGPLIESFRSRNFITYSLLEEEATPIEVLKDAYELLDMYNDENIEFTSKLSDIEKLSNVFTDFTNTFTIPASENNNRLFKHYYDVDIDNTFNANLRVDALLEIDSFPLRYGKLQLEGISVLNQMPDSYKITFYGELTQLTELFDDDTIDLLDYDKEIVDDVEVLVKNRTSLSQYDYDYNFTNLIQSINNPSFKDGNIITPLIAYTDRDWNIGGGTSIDITTEAGAILDSELRPAIKVNRIIDAIQTKYGIRFSDDFLESAMFNQLFMWMNNKKTGVLGNKELVKILGPLTGSPDAGNMLLINDFFRIDRQRYTDIAAVVWRASISYLITPQPSYTTVKYDAYLVNENGIIVKQWLNNTGNKTFNKEWKTNFQNGANTAIRIVEKVQLRIISNTTFGYSANVNLIYKRNAASIETIYTNISSVTNTGINYITIDMKDNLPKIKVIDFFQGLMKMFKLVIRPISSDSFYLNTLNGYYSDGNILNITPYTDLKNVNIERPLVYSKIEFQFEKTNNVAGKKYRELNDPYNDKIGYGDLMSKYVAIKKKEELSVKLPFENMLFERMTNQTSGEQSRVLIGQSISTSDNENFSINNSKPILFFNNGIVGGPDNIPQLNFLGDTNDLKYYPLIGNTNDELINQVTDTINWGAEIDPWHNQTVANSLYLNNWSNWVNTIYDLKQRKFSYTANLPSSFIEELSLNDVLIINNNRYRINDYKINLTNGETKLTLFNDIYKWGENSFDTVIDISTQLLSRNTIEANAGMHYYSTDVLYNIGWSVSKIDTGNGTQWITINTPSGTGRSEVVFVIAEKATQVPPAVYLNRSMELLFTFEGGQTRTVTILQKGLEE
jgi:hypothetical protein